MAQVDTGGGTGVRRARWSEHRTAAALACLAVSWAGCGGATAARLDLDAQQRLHTLAGRVQVDAWNGAPIIVALLASPETPDGPVQLYDYRVLDRPGERFAFLVDPPRRLRIVAFEDTNASTTCDPTERLAFFAGARELDIEGGGTDDHLDIAIAGPSLAAMPETAPATADTRSLTLGEVVTLDDPRFSPDTARRGLYEPLGFMRDVGAGIYYVEPYDTGRTPVLFVHGISGSPREFEALVAALDRSRYQAWLAHYPSGFELPLVAEHVDAALDELELRHGHRSFCVVAHSMGGLVMRDALARHARGTARADVPLFVTLASPMGGHAGAAMGVRLSPVVLPVWRSLDPSSDFVSHLYDHALPPESAYALLFAFGTSDASSDGIVPLTSQLRAEAEAEADVVHGVPATHTGILRDGGAIAAVLAQLDAHCAP